MGRRQPNALGDRVTSYLVGGCTRCITPELGGEVRVIGRDYRLPSICPEARVDNS